MNGATRLIFLVGMATAAHCFWAPSLGGSFLQAGPPAHLKGPRTPARAASRPRADRGGVCALRASSGGDSARKFTDRDDPNGELRALSAPMEPDPSLSSYDVVAGLVGGLQHNNLRGENRGLERFYNFADFTCRSALTARQGARSLQNFTKYAAREPVFSGLIHCEAFHIEQGTIIKGTMTRGDLATHVVTVSEVQGFRYRSGLERIPIEREGGGPGDKEIETRYRLTLQKERRPPLEGCWLVTECLCLKDSMIFNGDAGGTVY